MKSSESRRIDSRPDYFLLAIVTFTVLSRVLTSGPVYFGDGPEHMLVIREHTYLLQPPGYWLFNRFAGLFQDFESAMLVMNWCFSALGVMVFYRLAIELFEIHIARLGTVLYSVIFFAWFSGFTFLCCTKTLTRSDSCGAPQFRLPSAPDCGRQTALFCCRSSVTTY
jgi:hypothetical protein